MRLGPDRRAFSEQHTEVAPVHRHGLLFGPIGWPRALVTHNSEDDVVVLRPGVGVAERIAIAIGEEALIAHALGGVGVGLAQRSRSSPKTGQRQQQNGNNPRGLSEEWS